MQPGGSRRSLGMENTKTVAYHSDAWATLVETGWVTWTVDAGVALMVYSPCRR